MDRKTLVCPGVSLSGSLPALHHTTYDESSSLDQELGGQLQRVQGQLGLVVRILHPGGTDVGGTVVEDAVGLPGLEVGADGGAALLGGDVALEGDDLGDGLDRGEIDADDDAVPGHGLGANLTPGLGSVSIASPGQRIVHCIAHRLQGPISSGGRTPGAAQRSRTTLLFSRKPYFLLSWISLKAARARYPFSLASLYHLSRRPLPCFFWIAILSGGEGSGAGGRPLRWWCVLGVAGPPSQLCSQLCSRVLESTVQVSVLRNFWRSDRPDKR